MKKQGNIKSKVQDGLISNEDLENFLFASDKYIDSLEKENEELHWIVEDQDKTNTELTKWVAKSVKRAQEFRKEVDGLKEENDHLAEEVEELEDQAEEMYKHIRELEDELQNMKDIKMFDEIEQRLKQELEIIEEAEESVTKTRKKLVFIRFKDMFKKNPNIKNHVAAKELGVTEETIIKLKCMLVA